MQLSRKFRCPHPKNYQGYCEIKMVHFLTHRFVQCAAKKYSKFFAIFLAPNFCMKFHKFITHS